jgi:tRNA1Val (adenine37-N6)-methyltransferase
MIIYSSKELLTLSVDQKEIGRESLKNVSFQFKQFSIDDDQCAMKIGTDGVLLGAWVNVEGSKKILDIGTGSGLIALMLAQRTIADAKIDAVEIGDGEFFQAKGNILKSPWPEKIMIHHTAIQNFRSDRKYDLVVSNPPFFSNSLPPPSDQRKAARHTPSLSHEDLLVSAMQLIKDEGRFAVILPVKEGNRFIALAQFKGFYCIRQLAFFAREEKPQERWLFEFSRTAQPVKTEKLTLFSQQGWSEHYKKLVFDFYIHGL